MDNCLLNSYMMMYDCVFSIQCKKLLETKLCYC